MKVKREKSTEQRLRCPVLFSMWAGRRHRHIWAGAAGGNVKILLPETEAQGLAGSGEQREEAAGRAEGRNPAAEM